MGRHSVSMEKKTNGRLLTTEDFLWGTVIVLVLAQQRPISWAMLLTSFLYIVELALIVPHRKSRSIQSSQLRKGGDEGGCMQIALLSCFFHSSPVADRHSNLTKLLTLASASNEMITIVSLVGTFCLDSSLYTAQSAIFVFTWFCLTGLAKGRRGSLTKGEAGVLINLSTILIAETVLQISCHMSCWDVSHSLVAILGGTGCLAACVIVVFFRPPLWVRLQLHLFGPLVMVEIGLASRGFSSDFSDCRCVGWLFEFLLETEGGYPRYFGLIYWVTAFVVAFLPTRLVLESTSISVVVRRKWFHAVAVILFSPMSIIFPQLMSLSYAIALCVLAVLEDLRRDLPALQSFYLSFIDPTKDNPELILSHIFLILGCGMPLWISEWICKNGTTMESLLAQWGILCLGIGDAAGAVIGSLHGKHQWGQNRRTIEGSLAMWISVSVFGVAFVPVDGYLAILAAATIATLMEAFTSQMDNLVLPIVGSTIILLLQK